MTSVEENMALARRFMEARAKGNLEAVDEMMAPDFVNHTFLLSVQEPDREGVKWATAQLSAAISNPSIHFEDQVAAADKVVSRFVVHATHDRGELMGVAPTGRELTPTEEWRPGVRAQGRKCEAGGRSEETSAPNGIGTQGLHFSDLSVYTGRATELSEEVSLRGSEWTSKASPT